MKITAEACGESKSPENKGQKHGKSAREMGLRPPRTWPRALLGCRPLMDRGVLCALARPVVNGPGHSGDFSLVSLLPVEYVGKGNLL